MVEQGASMADRGRRAWGVTALRELAIPLVALAVLVVLDALLPLSAQIIGSFSLAAASPSPSRNRWPTGSPPTP
jgi:hypothetical protein